jgi:hypothetical protein
VELKKIRFLLLSCLFLLISQTAEAQVGRKVALNLPYTPIKQAPLPLNGTVWECWYGNSKVSCRLIRKPDPTADGYIPLSNQDVDPRLPESVGAIRNYPQLVENEIVTIPLIGPPFDIGFVAQLAESVMCNGRIDCGVKFRY